VAQFTEGYWRLAYHESKNGLPCGNVHDFFHDNANGDWVALVNCGVVHINKDGTTTQYFNQADDARKNARAIAYDKQGGTWIATDGGGVARFFAGEWKTFTTPQIPNVSVNDVKIDKYGRIWIATNKGVVYTSSFGQTWITLIPDVPVLHLIFGCHDCKISDEEAWLVVNDSGLIKMAIPSQP
jgi:ligand-binding sensor domain-containing protein